MSLVKINSKEEEQTLNKKKTLPLCVDIQKSLCIVHKQKGENLRISIARHFMYRIVISNENSNIIWHGVLDTSTAEQAASSG
jgi:hypothetical protein